MRFRTAAFVAMLTLAILGYAAPHAARAQITDPMAQQTDTLSQEDTFGNLIEALHNLSAETDSLQALTDLSQENVRIVSVDRLLADALSAEPNVEALSDTTMEETEAEEEVVTGDDSLQARTEVLENALERGQVELDSLREALSEHEVIKQALETSNVAIEDIVAVDVSNSGEVVIFYYARDEEKEE